MPNQALNIKRRKSLAQIHIAKKDLAMDEESYRSVILQVTKDKKNSAASLTASELIALVAKFKELGWSPKPPKASKKTAAAQDFRSKRIWLINKLWGELGTAGALTDPSTDALDNFCKKRMLGDKLEWASSQELNTIVDALKGWQKREAA